MKILTSAKINLNLKIHDGLQDNFHKIESDIIPVGIFDEIVIKESKKDQIVFNIDKLNNELTTIHKSLSLMRKLNPSFDKYFEIKVDKQIPIESGLGGGSSNGAAIINFLCLNYELSMPSYHDVVKYVGSDVPFFINKQPANISGIGENVLNLNDTPPMKIIIAVPKNGLSTKEVFEKYDETQPKETERYLWNDISLFNDLWNTSIEIYPELNAIKQNLEERYNKNFFMSGSGSALFSLFEEHEEIEEIDSEELNLKFFSITKKIDCSFSQNDD